MKTNPDKKPGRPTTYRADYARIAERFARLGATDAQLADALDVDERTVNRWKQNQPEFCQALKRGKMWADVEVCHALYRRANGYSHKAVKIFQHQGRVIEKEYTEHYPPDVTACIFWLKNRDPGRWRDRHDMAHANADGSPVGGVSQEVIEQAKLVSEIVFQRMEQLRQQAAADERQSV